MRIGGFQPLSLVDYPERPCSIVFTQGCLFRCAYCHNPDLIQMETSVVSWNEEAILTHLEKRKGIVDAVCISGGEPTIQVDIIDFLKKIRHLGLAIKLDTNGIMPRIVRQCIDEKLTDYIAMDLKAPWQKYTLVIGEILPDASERCNESFRLIQHSGIDHEFRTTISPGVHSLEDFEEMASYLLPRERYYVQQTSFHKTLDPALRREIGFDPEKLVEELKKRYGSCEIVLR